MKEKLKIYALVAPIMLTLSCAPKTQAETPRAIYAEDIKEYPFDILNDSNSNMLKREYSGAFHNNIDSLRFGVGLEVYIDPILTPDNAHSQLFSIMDSAICNAFKNDYLILFPGPDQWRNETNAQSGNLASTKDFLNRWSSLFSVIVENNTPEFSEDEYSFCAPSETVVLCHKVYEDNDFTTYMIATNYDFHSSCGCTYRADYLTFHNGTGKILNSEDLVTNENSSLIEDALLNAYRQISGMSDIENYSDLIEAADGVALVKNGVLFYYYPYKIGCGAEGQYNLIIDESLFKEFRQ